MACTRVARIVTFDGELEGAVAGQSVTVTLADEIDVSRGDGDPRLDGRPRVGDSSRRRSSGWPKPLLPGRTYFMRVGARTVGATISPLKYKLDLDSLERLAADKLDLNEIGVCAIELSEKPIAFDPYTENRDTGGFILIDRITNQTVGAGLLRFALRRSQNVHWQALDVDKGARAAAKPEGQRPCVLWLTGLSGAGKSTIANLVERRAARPRLPHVPTRRRQRPARAEQGPRVQRRRPGGEHPPDRRGGEADGDAGVIVIVSFICPFATATRCGVALRKGEFVEVYVKAPLEVAEGRDRRGCTRRRGAGRSRTSPASIHRTSRRSTRRSGSTRSRRRLRPPPRSSSRSCRRRGIIH